jgi:hypothetical protein
MLSGSPTNSRGARAPELAASPPATAHPSRSIRYSRRPAMAGLKSPITFPIMVFADPKNRNNFRTACCERFGCLDEDFESVVFFRCLRRHAILPARVLYFWVPSVFRWDIDLIRCVSVARSLGEFEQELNRCVQNNPPMGFLHSTLRIRLSGQKLMNLGRHIFSESAKAGSVPG